MRLLALFVTFAINFILLFYKVRVSMTHTLNHNRLVSVRVPRGDKRLDSDKCFVLGKVKCFSL